MPNEKELDLLLAAELESNPDFLKWVVGHTKFRECGAVFNMCRSNHPWGAHPFSITDSINNETTVSNRQSETDVLLIVRDRENRTLALHIENKLGSGKFTKLQPEMYAQRAKHWIGNPRYGGYTDFDTILLAPELFRQRNADQAGAFGNFISHESVARYIPQFTSTAGAA